MEKSSNIYKYVLAAATWLFSILLTYAISSQAAAERIDSKVEYAIETKFDSYSIQLGSIERRLDRIENKVDSLRK